MRAWTEPDWQRTCLFPPSLACFPQVSELTQQLATRDQQLEEQAALLRKVRRRWRRACAAAAVHTCHMCRAGHSSQQACTRAE